MIDDVEEPEASELRTRGRGRPRHRASEVGRDKLIERTRIAMNLRPRTDIQRREIAEAIGVTPALITYYFPDKWSLIEEAAQPIMTAHVVAVQGVLASSSSTREKFRALIKIYLNFSRDHGYLLEYYISASEQLNKSGNIKTLASTHMLIVDFFSDGIRNGEFGDVDPETLQATLWSICQYLGKKTGERQSDHRSSIDSLVETEINQSLVFEIFTRGILQSPQIFLEAEDFD